MEQLEKLPPDQQATQMNIAVKATKYISYGFPVFILLVVVITAAVLMGSFNFGAGAQVSFGKAMAVVMYSHLPGIIKTILVMVAIFAGMDPEGFRIDNPIATNPGFFFSPTDHPALYKLASSIDIFTIWTLVLMAIGFTYVMQGEERYVDGHRVRLVCGDHSDWRCVRGNVVVVAPHRAEQ